MPTILHRFSPKRKPYTLSATRLFWRGFIFFLCRDAAGKYPTQQELAELNPSVLAGYIAAIDAAEAEAESTYRYNLNAWGDLTTY